MNAHLIDRPQVPQLYLAEELTARDIRTLGAVAPISSPVKPFWQANIDLEWSLCLSNQMEKDAAYDRAYESLASLATERTMVGYEASRIFNSLPAFEQRRGDQLYDQTLCEKLGAQLGTMALELAGDLQHVGICCEVIAQGICALNGDVAFPTTFREGGRPALRKYNHDIYLLIKNEQTGRIHKLPFEIKALQARKRSDIPRIYMLETLYVKRRGIYGYDGLPPKGGDKVRKLPDDVKREVLAQSAQLIIDISKGRPVSDPDKLFMASVKKAVKEKINESRLYIGN